MYGNGGNVISHTHRAHTCRAARYGRETVERDRVRESGRTDSMSTRKQDTGKERQRDQVF